MTAFGDAAAVTPEINHTLMVAGDLGESLVQAAAGYESVADMLLAELTAMGLNTSSTAMVGWQGPAGVIYEMTAAQFCAVCAAASAWVRVGQIQAAEVAAAHTAAVEMMIPAAVCLSNRATQAALIQTNFIGQNTPAIIGLEAQYDDFWVTNATARTGYGHVVTTALGAIGEPPPFAPMAPNPADPALGVAQAAAQDGGQDVLQVSTQTMTQTADAPSKAMGAPSTAEGLMTSMAGQASSLFGSAGSALGEFTSAGQQLPSMLGQAPQMFSGMLGPLMSGVNGGMPAGAIAPEAAGALAAPAAVGGGLAGGGGGGLVSGPSSLASTFVRPANSFSAPTAPTLPGGWQGESPASAETQARPAGMGGGGLYGAPAALGREAGGPAGADKPAKTMQVTARSGSGRGERHRN